MTDDRSFDEAVAPLRGDVESGASELATDAAIVLGHLVDDLEANSTVAFMDALTAAGSAVMRAQPAMAPLLTLVREVLQAAEAAETVDAARRAAGEVADGFAEAQRRRTDAVVRAAGEVLAGGGRIATHSASSTVLRSLEKHTRGDTTSVVCFESRPHNEGRRTARALAEHGLDVTYAVDAAMQALVPTCSAVVIGADSVGDSGVVNKIGSTALATIARAADIPFYVLVDGSKLLPGGFPQVVSDDRGADEVWDGPSGVEIWNRYFEFVPTALVTAFVTEAGARSPAALEETRRSVRVSPRLMESITGDRTDA